MRQAKSLYYDLSLWLWLAGSLVSPGGGWSRELTSWTAAWAKAGSLDPGNGNILREDLRSSGPGRLSSLCDSG